MADAVERLINLAMFFDARHEVTADVVRTSVEGYPADQDDVAFKRMFERDKDTLREWGLVIVSDTGGDSYRLDREASFAADVELSPAEAAALRAVGYAMLADPAFPFAEDLRSALVKLATGLGAPLAPTVSHSADERPEEQADTVSELRDAVVSAKRVAFAYTNALGEHKHHTVEPYGIFAREGRWYLVGRDTDLDEQRVYTVSKMEAVEPNRERPKHPDFEHPGSFDVNTFIGLPFQYGNDEFDATLRLDAGSSWRADALTAGVGTLEWGDDDSATWHVTARSRRRLLQWAVENGPGLAIVTPALAAEELREGLKEVLRAHG
jgi:proteasome accessory factor B